MLLMTNVSADSEQNNLVAREDIQKYFAVKRKQHLEAVQTLLKFQRYEQKYEMLSRIFDKIFEVLEISRPKVENSEYILGGDLPSGSVTENILMVLDNCAFFGNLILKLPDISDRILKDNNQWVDLYKWCFTFSTEANLVDDMSLKMFNIAAQQLNLLPREKDFVNPYSEKQSMKNKKTDFSTNESTGKSKKKTLPAKRPKGPRMSKIEL